MAGVKKQHKHLRSILSRPWPRPSPQQLIRLQPPPGAIERMRLVSLLKGLRRLGMAARRQGGRTAGVEGDHKPDSGHRRTR